MDNLDQLLTPHYIYIVPGIYGENGEINLYFKLNINDGILTPLKQNGGRKSIDELVEELGKYRAFSEEEVKCGLFELVRSKKIMLDEKRSNHPSLKKCQAARLAFYLSIIRILLYL